MARVPNPAVVSLGQGAKPLAKRLEAALPTPRAATRMGSGRLIVVDGAAKTSAADRKMLIAARQEGAVFLLQNAQPGGVTRSLGLPFGLASELSAVRASPDGRRVHVTALKPFEEVQTGKVEEAMIENATRQPTKKELAKIENAQWLANSKAVLDDQKQDAARVVRLLSNASWRQQLKPRSAATDVGTARNRAWATVVIPTKPWHVGAGKQKQAAKVWGSWEIEMCACPDATGKPGKYLFITTKESGANSGKLLKDEGMVRGFFTEEVTLGVRLVQKKGRGYKSAPLPAGSTLAVAPKTDNSKNQYTTTTGWQVKGSASSEKDSIEVGFSSEEQATREIPDFMAINNSDGTAALWTFRVAFAEGRPYETYKDLYNWLYIRRLPALSTSSCTLETQAVYFFPADFDSQITLEFSVEHVLRSCWFKFTSSASKRETYIVRTYQTFDLSGVSL